MNTTQTQQKPSFSREIARGEISSASLSPEELEKLRLVKQQHQVEIDQRFHNDWNSYSESWVSNTEKKSLKIGDRTELRFDSSTINTEIGIPAEVINEASEPVTQVNHVVKTFESTAPGIHLPPIKGEVLVDVTEKAFKTVNNKIRKPIFEAAKDWWKEFVAFKLTLPKKETPEQKKKKEEEANKSRNNRGFIENLRQLLSGSRRKEAAIASKRAEVEQMNRDKHASNISDIEGKLDLNDYTKISIHEQAEWDKNKTESTEEQLNKKREAQVAASGASKKSKGPMSQSKLIANQNLASENPYHPKTALQ